MARGRRGGPRCRGAGAILPRPPREDGEGTEVCEVAEGRGDRDVGGLYRDLRGWMLKLDTGDDGLRVDPGFLVDFHPARAGEIHLPGGDPTTEIFS